MNIMSHERIEKSVVILGILTFFAVIWGGLVQIVPLFFDNQLRPENSYVKPYDPLRLAGFNIYVREGCYGCHSQMIRPFRWETERYGHYSVAEESMYDRPFMWGSKRTGPDLARVGGRYSDEWHRRHLMDPRSVQLDSNMPAFPWLARNRVDGETVASHMRALRKVGVPYSDEEIAAAPAQVEGKSEMDAVIAYLQGLGLALKNNNIQKQQ